MDTLALKQKIAAAKTLADLEAIYPPRNLPEGAEITRAAPSPTGFPHIGTAMQSIIDRALADKKGGRFILRIEDTDLERSVPGAIENIRDTLNWVGATPDEDSFEKGGDYGPYTQSDRLPIYKIAADHLVQSGHAYRCFCTPARLDELREAQTKAKMMPKYDRKCRTLTADEITKLEAEGVSSVVRLKIPPPGTKIRFTDLVRGEIEFDGKVLDDHILLKTDGFPTYHLAVVVDDHFMRVTTTVRGEEWISSAPKHVLTYQAFGWEIPKFLHTVLLRGEDKRKLSKRSGDTSVNWFRAQGYLPAGMRNFLTRLIWAHPGNKDIYEPAEFTQLFEPSHLQATGPVVDMKLLGFINGKYLAALKPFELRDTLTRYLEYLLGTDQLPDITEEDPGVAPLDRHVIDALRHSLKADPAYAEKVLALEPERHQKLSDILYNCAFFFDSTFRAPSPALIAKICPDAAQAKKILADIAAAFDPAIDHEAWDKSIRAIAATHAVKDKIVFMLARAAVTGQERTPPLFEIQHLLGESRVRARLAGAAGLAEAA